MKQLHWIFSVGVWTISFLGLGLALVGQESTPILGARKAALLVDNRAGEEFKKLAAQLEDQLSSRAASPGLVFIGRQLVTDAIAKEGAGAQLDALLSERTSALRLAQSLGADWIVLASLSSVTREERTFNDGTLQLTSHNHVLRISYKIAEAAEGGVLAGDSIRVSRNIRGTQTAGVESSEIFNQLVDDAVIRLLQVFPDKVLQVAKTGVTKPSQIEISVSAVPVDLTQNPLQLPDLRVGNDGSITKGSSGSVDVLLGDVSIEMDGVLVGTTPATLRLAPGFHKLRLTRPGFGAVEQTINPVTGLKLRPALQMSEVGYARWRDTVAFLQAIEVNRKLTDSQVKAVEGFAKMLEQSGYRVDVREDNKIQINGKSLYDGAILQNRNRN
jgi:PEGA domain